MIVPSLALAILPTPPCLPGAQEAPAATHLVFATSPALDLYFHLRSVAASGGRTTVEAFAPAVKAAKELDLQLGGSFLAWGALEGLLPGCQTAAEIRAAFAVAPLTLEVRGASVPLREGALGLGAALIAAEPAFQEPWKRRERRIAAARERWETQVAPKERALLEFHLHSLAIADPGLAIPVYLVAEAPFPGAVTHRDDQGKGVCFVAVDGAPGTQLFETILHEATHALDLATNEASALGELRSLLLTAGVDARDRATRDLPHLLMFVQAAESIRRVIDPEHQDYGELAKVYERFGPSAEAVRGFWRDHLDGRATREAALEAIVAGAIQAK